MKVQLTSKGRSDTIGCTISYEAGVYEGLVLTKLDWLQQFRGHPHMVYHTSYHILSRTCYRAFSEIKFIGAGTCDLSAWFLGFNTAG